MKLTIDTEAKTVFIQGNFKIKELENILKGFNLTDYEVTTFQPITISAIPPFGTPNITYTNNGAKITN